MWVIQHREDRRRVSPFLSHTHQRLNASYFSQIFHLPGRVHDTKACTILLRGPSKNILNEIDRNLADPMSVARNVVFNPMLVPGGGAFEAAISVGCTSVRGL